MGQEDFDTLLNFFKVLGNENRLKLVGILAGGDYTVRELATMLKLKEPTVSEHLTMLKEMNLVTVRPEGNFRIYSFNPKALRGMNKELLSRESFASLVDDVVDDPDRKVMQAFVKDDYITSFPVADKSFSSSCAGWWKSSRMAFATPKNRSTKSCRTTTRITPPCAAA